jgi:UrcA family protein
MRQQGDQMKSTAGVSAALLLFVCSASTMAAEEPSRDDAPATRVAFHDLNLRNAAGVATLYNRLSGAATKVCRDYKVLPRELSRHVAYERCITEALDRAISGVNNSMLNEYAAQRRGTRLERVAQK